MFKEAFIDQLAAQDSAEVLKELHEIQVDLNRRFFDMEDAIKALVLAVASGEPLLFIGPPGTAKSRLIRAFCAHLGMLNLDQPQGEHADYFEYLLTPFTEPNELFGYFDLSQEAIKAGLSRKYKGTLVEAKVAFLDEVFNGSSAILNSLLTVIHEGVFHDRGQRRPVALKCLFGATNAVPHTAELRALFDRFLLRCWVSNVSEGEEADSAKMINRVRDLAIGGWRETMGKNLRVDPQVGEKFFREIKKFQDYLVKSLNHLDKSIPGFFPLLTEKVIAAAELDNPISNRRLIKMLKVMLVHRVFNKVNGLPNGKDKTEENWTWQGQMELFHFFMDSADVLKERQLKESHIDGR